MEEGQDEEKKIQVEKTRGTQEFEGRGSGWRQLCNRKERREEGNLRC